MKKYNLRMNFFWDEEDDMKEFFIYVPNAVLIDDISKELINAHEYLVFKDETEIYGKIGRNPETLIDYVCKKNKWKYEEFVYDIDLNFD